MVARGQGTHFIDDIHEHLGAVGGKALARDRILGEDFFLLGGDPHELLGVVNVAHPLGAPNRDGLQIFRAHDGTHAGATGGAMQIVDHCGKEHLVFTGQANRRNTRERVLMVFLNESLRLPDTLAPEVGGIAKLDLVVLDGEVHGLGRLALKNDHVPTSHLQFGAPVATRVRAGNGSRERPFGNHHIAASGGGHGAGEWPRGPDDLVLSRERIHFRVDLFGEVFGGQPSRAQILGRPGHVEGFVGDGALGEVHPKNLACPCHG